jgi:two-component system nitrate/nitrite response regulator NarL
MRSEHEPETVAVAIVSADPLVRVALAASVRVQAELEVVEDVAAADVVVWDPGLDSGSARYRELRDFGVPVAALVTAPEQVSAALAEGAQAVLARDVTPAALAAALLAIHRGLSVLDSTGRALLAHEPVEPDAARGPAEAGAELTARELEVLQLLAAGLSNKAIARRLAISEHTAKFHVNSILGKLGASSRTEAVVAAARKALVIL